ncbi:hypothetical protein SETIT_6G245300v2 [Setaria italica]|uniref:Uncharacterized protein n=1 Tax=Setaria italica TaxID=4555 RepID=A0A368RQ07_SETIT|nr:hypothetical protein SETIT_6G245300v2 [Setaria italica]
MTVVRSFKFAASVYPLTLVQFLISQDYLIAISTASSTALRVRFIGNQQDTIHLAKPHSRRRARSW